jgi:hypothetical protein
MSNLWPLTLSRSTQQSWRAEQQLIQLQDALSKGIIAGDSDAAEAIRDLLAQLSQLEGKNRARSIGVP